MLVDGDVENREQFEKKLKLLQEQWNKVVKRSQEKKGEIDRLVAQWLIYKNQKDRLQVGNFSFKIRKLKIQEASDLEELFVGATDILVQ